MIDPKDQPSQAPSPSSDDKETVRPISIPRPSELQPLNAVSNTPPPVELAYEETPLLVDDDLLLDDDDSDATTSKLDLHSSDEPTAHGSQATASSSRPAPLAVKSRFSTAPPQPSLMSRLASSGSSPQPQPPDASPSDLPSSPSAAPIPLVSPKALPSTPFGLRPPLTPGRLSSPGTRSSAAPAALSHRHSLSPRGLSLRPSTAPRASQEAPVECPSAERLASNGLTERWLHRAAMFETHASTAKDVRKKSRLLVLASELYAMAGHLNTARLVADRAAKLGNHIAQRQARQLAQKANDTKAAASYFGLETNTAPTNETRRHSLLAHAEFERWTRKDLLAHSRLWEQLTRLTGTNDPLPGVLGFAKQLGQQSAAPDASTLSNAPYKELARAADTLRRLRGETISDESTGAPVAAFLAARRALERRDRVAAATALVELRAVPGLERAALWLASCLLAPAATTRRKAVELLTELDARRSTKAVRRALVARALELGDKDAVLAALNADLDKDPAERAFLPADQLTLRALSHTTSPELLRDIAAQSVPEDDHATFAAAALCADCPELVGPLGAVSQQAITASHRAGFAANPPTSEDFYTPLLQLLGVHSEPSNWSVDKLLALPGLAIPTGPRHLTFVAGALAETRGDSTRAQALFSASVTDGIAGEAALQYLLATQDTEAASQLLESFAQEQVDSDARAVAFVRAALSTNDTARREQLCLQAYAVSPQHVLVEAAILKFAAVSPFSETGNTEASPSSDRSPASTQTTLTSKRLAILSHQSTKVEDEYVRALALLRHVFSKPRSASRAPLLDHAWELWPKDLALLSLREQLSNLPLDVRAQARETLVHSVTGPRTRSALRVEAALLYELAGLPSAAARVAKPDEQRPPLLEACFARNAPGTEFAAAWRQNVMEQAQSTGDAVERAHYWLQAARLAFDAGDWVAEREAMWRSITSDNNSLEGLLAAEALAFKDGDVERVAEVERYLSEVLQSPDHLAHAQLASRFFQLSTGSSSGYALLCACVDEGRTPLEVARKLAYLAPRMGDEELGYRMLTQLLDTAPRTPDKAALLLRCAELAMRLGRSGTALIHLDDVNELQPENVSAWSLRGEILAKDGFYAAAAEAFERLGNVAKTPHLRSAAHKRAAQELLRESAVTSGEPGDLGPTLPTTIADPSRLRVNLERALEADPTDDEVREQLIALHVRLGLENELNDLFVERLKTASPELQSSVLLRWSEACAAMGSTARAFELIKEVLTKNPENPNALEQLAELTGDAQEREQSLLQVIRVSPAPEQQAKAFRQLGDFYKTNAQRARATKCYHEAWKRRPDDYDTFRVLVDALIEGGDLAAAQATIDSAAQRATSDPERRRIAIAQAALAGASDWNAGETQLLSLFDERPFDNWVVAELSQLYVRWGHAEKLEELEGRVRSNAERELPQGPHVAQYLSALAELAQLRANQSSQALIRAVSSLFHGTSSGMDARGSRALSRSLDAHLAPAPLGEPLRSLLARSCDALEEAFPLNIAALSPTALTEPKLRASFEMKAKAVGIAAPDLLVVAGEPYFCQVSSRPGRVYLGVGWVSAAPSALLDFVVWRCLKLLQARVGTMANLTEEATALRVDALLSGYAPVNENSDESPQPNSLRSVLHPLLPKDTTLGPLASESRDALQGSALTASEAIALWAERCALLATGEPRTALHAVCLLNGETPEHLPQRLLEAVGRVAAARRLLTSLLDPAFAEAHRAIH